MQTIAVDHTHGYVYWSNQPNISRATLNGSVSGEIITGKFVEVIGITIIIMSVTFFLLPRCMFSVWCLIYSFPYLSVQRLACSLLGWWVPMFLCYGIAGSTHELYSYLFKHVPMKSLKISRCLASAVYPVLILLWISLSWWLSLGAVYLNQVNVAYNVLGLSVVDIIILITHFPSSPLFSNCSSSKPDFNFRQLIPVAVIVNRVMCVSPYEYIVSDIRSLSSCLWFPKSIVVGICIRVHGRHVVSLPHCSHDVDLVVLFV